MLSGVFLLRSLYFKYEIPDIFLTVLADSADYADYAENICDINLICGICENCYNSFIRNSAV